MNKKIKVLAVFAGVTCAAALVNKVIFNNADKKTCKIQKPAGIINAEVFYFEWRYGRIRYIACGEGEPLLLLHDARVGASLSDWKTIIPLLAKRYRVYAIDLPGFGMSDKPRLSYSTFLYVSFINDFIKHIGEAVNVIADGASAGFAAAGCAFCPDIYKTIIMLGSGDEKIKRAFPLLGRIIEIPVYGTLMYNILTSAASVGLRRHILSHCGGVGNKHVLSAALRNFLFVDPYRFISKIKSAHVIEKRRELLDDPRFFYKTVRKYLTE